MKHFILSVFVFILAVTGVSAQKTLPSVSIKNLDGKSLDIQSVAGHGKITVISFWATWCGPCKKELDEVNKVYADWQKKYNMELVAITIDDSRGLPKVKPMVAEKRWSYTVLSDANSDLKSALNIPNVPYTLLLDGAGNIVWSHSGYVPGDEKELEAQLAALAKK
jgi:cytochrome c biogenesis protein CcmG, thiol:disulfide interchange protein DsbE